MAFWERTNISIASRVDMNETIENKMILDRA